MTVTVEIKSKPSNPTVWLEVTYAGLEPPVALFDDLAMVGWTPPPIPPPPASAIDWSRPDPSTGQSFTFIEYVVEGAVVDAPRGSGPLGRWNDADRRAHLAVLEGVLRRHDLLDQLKERKRRGRAAPEPTESTPAPPEAQRSAPARSSPARRPSVDLTQPTALPVDSVRLTAAISPTSEAAMAAALANAGVRNLSFTPVHRVVVNRYRGAETESRVLDHLRLEIVAPIDIAEDVQATVARTAVAQGHAAPEITIEISQAPTPSHDESSPHLHAVTEVRSA